MKNYCYLSGKFCEILGFMWDNHKTRPDIEAVQKTDAINEYR